MLCLLVGSLSIGAGDGRAQEVFSDTAILPKGSTFGGFRNREPRQVLTVERLGAEQGYLVALGNMAFSSPGLFGGAAEQAGLSCATCHSSGDINKRVFIVGGSSHPGSADVTSSLFNIRNEDELRNPLDIPSLRGLKFTAPYGRDGRFASLHDFTRNVLVNEFAGAETDPLILDALVAYQQQFEFLANPQLDAQGRLTEQAPAAAKRGEALFHRPFAAMSGRSCASCHVPASHFTDNRPYDVGTGAVYVTPALLNTQFTAPYFATGIAETFADVVAHFDDYFGLGLNPTQRADLVAYLEAVGDGEQPYVARDFEFELAEVLVFASTLEQTIADRNASIVDLTVDTINAELRDMRERWTPADGRQPRAILAEWVLQMRRIDLAAEAGDWKEARSALASWEVMVERGRDAVSAAQAQSFYNPARLAERRDTFESLSRTAGQ